MRVGALGRQTRRLKFSKRGPSGEGVAVPDRLKATRGRASASGQFFPEGRKVRSAVPTHKPQADVTQGVSQPEETRVFLLRLTP